MKNSEGRSFSRSLLLILLLASPLIPRPPLNPTTRLDTVRQKATPKRPIKELKIEKSTVRGLS